MGQIKKKGTSGNAKNFITRTQAIKKLQISLADFRRLCIFKGIYPRVPRNKKKANKGSTAPVVFYYAKDILSLLNESVLKKFRENKTFLKKLLKVIGRNEFEVAKKYQTRKPVLHLDHIIKERYPTFLDALRDLDDPLNMLFLFSKMKSTTRLNNKLINISHKLCTEWMAYISKLKLIDKVFVSIKGVYYQVLIKGQEIRWLVPFSFPTNIPDDVDLKIMITFLEFYCALLRFVLYKLYTDSSFQYPPVFNKIQNVGFGELSSYVLNLNNLSSTQIGNSTDLSINKKTKKIMEKESEKLIKLVKLDDVNDEQKVQVKNDEFKLDKFVSEFPDEDLKQPTYENLTTSKLFESMVFYVGREVPLDLIEVCILSCGGKIISEIGLIDLKKTDTDAYKKLDFSSVTHHVFDRQKLIESIEGRIYIQPQWIFDSINAKSLLPLDNYGPGKILPPHLSPWGDANNYDPNLDLDEYSNDEEKNITHEKNDIKNQNEEELIDVSICKDENAKVLHNTLDPSFKKKKSSSKNIKKELQKKNEDLDLKKIMMTKKKSKLYNKIQYGLQKSATKRSILFEKKKLRMKSNR